MPDLFQATKACQDDSEWSMAERVKHACRRAAVFVVMESSGEGAAAHAAAVAAYVMQHAWVKELKVSRAVVESAATAGVERALRMLFIGAGGRGRGSSAACGRASGGDGAGEDGACWSQGGWCRPGQGWT
jgi:hypothetical protein